MSTRIEASDRFAGDGGDRLTCKQRVGGRREGDGEWPTVEFDEIGAAFGRDRRDRSDVRRGSVELDLGDGGGKRDGFTESTIDGRARLDGGDLDGELVERHRTGKLGCIRRCRRDRHRDGPLGVGDAEFGDGGEVALGLHDAERRCRRRTRQGEAVTGRFAERCDPARGRVAVEGGGSTSGRHTREVPVVADVLAEECGEHVAAGALIEAERHGRVGHDRSSQFEPALHCRFGIAAPTVGRIGSQASEQQTERSIGRLASHAQRVDRWPDELRGGPESEVDLGETDPPHSVADGRLRVARRSDGDGHLGGVVGRLDVDALSGALQRGLIEIDTLHRPIIDREVDRSDGAVLGAGVGLAQRDVVDSGIGAQHDELADGRGPIGDSPAGRRIAVDRHHRSMLGQIRERLAVGGRSSRDGSRLHRDGLGGLVGSVEDGEPLVGALEAQHVGAFGPGLGEPRDILRAAPVVGTVTIRVGHEESRRRTQRIDETIAERGAVADQFGPVDDSRAGGIDDPGAVTGEHDLVGLDPDRRHRIGDSDERDGRDRCADPTVADRLLVDHRPVGLHGRRFTEAHRSKQSCVGSRRRRQEVVDDLRPGEPEAVEGDIARDPDGVDPQESCNGRDAPDVECAVLEAVVECEDEVHGGGTSEREQIACDRWALGQRRQRLVDRVPPPVGAELGSRNLQYPVPVREFIEVRRCIEPTRRHVGISLQRGVDETTGTQSGKVGDGKDRDDHCDHTVGTNSMIGERQVHTNTTKGADRHRGAEGQAEHEHRHRTGAAA